jgi:transposase
VSWLDEDSDGIGFQEVLETDVVNTGKRNRMSPAEIETLLKEAEADLLSEKPTNLKRLGIDEITHLKGGKNYAAVLVDLDRRKPIALLEKRNKEVIAQYLLGLGSEILNQIKEVSIDLWIPYKSVIEELLPQAQVVADRFHVMKQINEELDRRRKSEKRQAEKLKKKLEEVRVVAPELMKAYQLKEQIRDIFESQITADEAFWHLIEWTRLAFQYFSQSCQTIKRWIDEILAYFDNRTTQGAVEGINQKIKLIKRRAYGLTNFSNFRRRVLLNWYFC